MNALLRLTSGLIPLAAAIACGAATPARAQQAEDIDKYPSKTVHIVVAFPAGSGNDLVARIAAQFLTDHFGRSFVVDNVVGGGGTLMAGDGLRDQAQPELGVGQVGVGLRVTRCQRGGPGFGLQGLLMEVLA